MIVQHFTPQDSDRFFVVVQFVCFHVGPVKTCLFVMIVTLQNLTVLLCGTVILFVVTISFCIGKEPFFNRTVSHCLIKQVFRLNILILLKVCITLLIQTVCFERRYNKAPGKHKQQRNNKGSSRSDDCNRKDSVLKLILK